MSLELIQAKPFIQPVFDIIRQSHGPFALRDVQRTLQASFPNAGFYLDSALRHLEFLGIITQSGTGKERTVLLNGEFCRRWFETIFDPAWINVSNQQMPMQRKVDTPQYVWFIDNSAKEFTMGDNITIREVSGSNINVHARLQGVIQSIGTLSKGDQGTKEELTQLVAQLTDVLTQVPAENAEEAKKIADRVDMAVKEAGEDKPDEEKMEFSLESLKKAAANIAGVLPAVLPIATQIVDHIRKLVS
jgi:hypothetical protein